MPRIPQHYLDCIVFCYNSRDDAEQSKPEGGTGFIAGRQSHTGELRLYVITNRHVAKRAVTLRFHRNGTSSLVDVDQSNWVYHPATDDVAAVCLRVENPIEVPQVLLDAFITQDFVRQYGIRPGMEAFMMGRLVGRDGAQQTNPSVRFGHLAMMPDRVRRDDGLFQDSFLVDLLSLTGHSGSPVFIYETHHHFPGDHENQFPGVRLLGINWGFYPKQEAVWSFTEKGEKHNTGIWIDGNSGFAAVVPSWKILEVLEEVDRTGAAAEVMVSSSSTGRGIED